MANETLSQYWLARTLGITSLNCIRINVIPTMAIKIPFSPKKYRARAVAKTEALVFTILLPIKNMPTKAKIRGMMPM